jgi:hypothetical protein
MKPPNVPVTDKTMKPPLATNIDETKKSKSLFNSKGSTGTNTEYGTDPEVKLNGVVGFDYAPYQYVRRCQNNG